jgi:hypothetical protein
VIYESMYGSTHTVAEAVGEGSGPAADDARQWGEDLPSRVEEMT